MSNPCPNQTAEVITAATPFLTALLGALGGWLGMRKPSDARKIAELEKAVERASSAPPAPSPSNNGDG